MALSMPPSGGRPPPLIHTLDSGKRLWRIHSDDFDPTEFNPTIPVPFGGGRFDCTDGTYAYLYAGSDSIAAVAETLLRDRPPKGPYWILRKSLVGKRLSKLSLATPLGVAVLRGAGLTAIRQKADLTSCGPAEYSTTRAWGVSLRADAPSSCGFEWHPRHDNDRLAYVFFGDRCTSSDFVVEQSYSLEEGRGRSLLNRALALHGVVVSP